MQPFSVAGLDTATTPGASTARTFSWMKTGVTEGEHTIEVLFYVTGGTAGLVGRTLTIPTFSSHDKQERGDGLIRYGGEAD